MLRYLFEMEKIAERLRIKFAAPLQGAQIGAFTVLAPSPARYFNLIPSSRQDADFLRPDSASTWPYFYMPCETYR